MFDALSDKEQKKTWIYYQIIKIVEEAKAGHGLIALEYLGFELWKR